MVDVQELAGSKQGLRQLSLMVSLVGLADGSRQAVTHALYEDAKDQGSDRSVLNADFATLMEYGWLWFEKTSVVADVVVTQAAIDAVEEFESMRSSPQKRNMTARDRLLHWLYDAYLASASCSKISDYLEHPDANFYGLPFTEDEVARAGEWLYLGEYISGAKTWGAEILRPSIATKGTRVVESGASVNAPEGSGGTTVNNNNIKINGSHSLNVAAGSSYVTQSNTVSIEQIKQTAEFIESTRSLVPMLGLPTDQQKLVAEIVDALEAETAAAAPNQSKMKELVGKVVDIAVTGTATGFVNALVTMGTGIMTTLG